MKDAGNINTTNVSMLPHDGYQYLKNAILRHNANILKHAVYRILNQGKYKYTVSANVTVSRNSNGGVQHTQKEVRSLEFKSNDPNLETIPEALHKKSNKFCSIIITQLTVGHSIQLISTRFTQLIVQRILRHSRYSHLVFNT